MLNNFQDVSMIEWDAANGPACRRVPLRVSCAISSFVDLSPSINNCHQCLYLPCDNLTLHAEKSTFVSKPSDQALEDGREKKAEKEEDSQTMLLVSRKTKSLMYLMSLDVVFR